jgi:hypothetical protein
MCQLSSRVLHNHFLYLIEEAHRILDYLVMKHLPFFYCLKSVSKYKLFKSLNSHKSGSADAVGKLLAASFDWFIGRLTIQRRQLLGLGGFLRVRALISVGGCVPQDGVHKAHSLAVFGYSDFYTYTEVKF